MIPQSSTRCEHQLHTALPVAVVSNRRGAQWPGVPPGRRSHRVPAGVRLAAQLVDAVLWTTGHPCVLQWAAERGSPHTTVVSVVRRPLFGRCPLPSRASDGCLDAC